MLKIVSGDIIKNAQKYNAEAIVNPNNNQYYAEIVNDKGITIDNRAITEDEIKKVLVYKDIIR